MNNINLVIDAGPDIHLCDLLMKQFSNLEINYIEVINDYLMNLRTREINRHYNQIYTQERLWNDDSLLEMSVSTLEAKLINEVVFPLNEVYSVCKVIYGALKTISIGIEETINQNPLGKDVLLHYNFECKRRVENTMFLFSEIPEGGDLYEPSFHPWVRYTHGVQDGNKVNGY